MCTRGYMCNPMDNAFLFLLIFGALRQCKLQTRHDKTYFGESLNPYPTNVENRVSS